MATEKEAKDLLAAFPRGCIMAWYGELNQVPDGWKICDGQNGTPDLRGRFLRGAQNAGEYKQPGGRETHAHTCSKNGRLAGEGWNKDGSCELGATDPQNHLPPYINIHWIIKL